MQIAAVLFPRVTALDIVGPYGVLQRLPGVTVTFDEVMTPDVVVVPGGIGTRNLLDDQPLLDWVRHVHRTTRFTTSVCTGSLVLGAAGVSSGIDMALRLSELLFDETAARAMQLGIEFDPQPPFGSDHPDRASDAVKQRLADSTKTKD